MLSHRPLSAFLVVPNPENISGSRDAALTAHGALQAQHLAAHLVRKDPPLSPPSHIFASDLQRAWRTAEAVRQGYLDAGLSVPSVQRLPELREQDFGSLEGTAWRGPLPPVEDGWVDPETPESILRRVGQFLDVHLFPAVDKLVADGVDGEASVVVAAHGVTLRHLVSALVRKLRKGGCPVYGLAAEEQVLHWRNTGYFECLFEATAPGDPPARSHSAAAQASGVASFLSGLKVTAERMNCVDHLAGLSKTKGGIGSAAFDANQKTINTFFAKKDGSSQ